MCWPVLNKVVLCNTNKMGVTNEMQFSAVRGLETSPSTAYLDSGRRWGDLM